MLKTKFEIPKITNGQEHFIINNPVTLQEIQHQHNLLTVLYTQGVFVLTSN